MFNKIPTDDQGPAEQGREQVVPLEVRELADYRVRVTEFNTFTNLAQNPTVQKAQEELALQETVEKPDTPETSPSVDAQIINLDERRKVQAEPETDKGLSIDTIRGWIDRIAS